MNADAVQDICVESDATEKYAALSGNIIKKSDWFTITYQLTFAVHANVHHCGFLSHQGEMSRYASACFFSESVTCDWDHCAPKGSGAENIRSLLNP